MPILWHFTKWLTPRLLEVSWSFLKASWFIIKWSCIIIFYCAKWASIIFKELVKMMATMIAWAAVIVLVFEALSGENKDDKKRN